MSGEKSGHLIMTGVESGLCVLHVFSKDLCVCSAGIECTERGEEGSGQLGEGNGGEREQKQRLAVITESADRDFIVVNILDRS